MNERTPKEIVGTHQGHLESDARDRRAIKKARYLHNKAQRAQDNKTRSSR